MIIDGLIGAGLGALIGLIWSKPGVGALVGGGIGVAVSLVLYVKKTGAVSGAQTNSGANP